MENSPEFYRGMIQAIMGERGFPKNPIDAENELFYRLGELASGDDPVISEREATECWRQYRGEEPPNIRIKHLGEIVSKDARFYE